MTMPISTAIARCRNLHGVHFDSLLSDEEHVELFNECSRELTSRYPSLPVWEKETYWATQIGSNTRTFDEVDGAGVPTSWGHILDLRVEGDQSHPRVLTPIGDNDFDLLDPEETGLPKYYKYWYDANSNPRIRLYIWPTPDQEEIITLKYSQKAAGIYADPQQAVDQDKDMPLEDHEWLWIYSAAVDVCINRGVNMDKVAGLLAKKEQKQIALLDFFNGSASTRPMKMRLWR